MRERGGTRNVKKAISALAVICLAALLLSSAVPLRAQLGQERYRYTYASYDVDITVGEDSILHVQERVTYSFGAVGERVGIYIPFDYGVIYNPQVLNDAGNPLPPGVQEVEYGNDGVTLWYDASGTSGDSTVIYDYYSFDSLGTSGD